MKLTTRDDMAPEMLAASARHTKAEKLSILEKMRRDALKRREDGDLAGAGAGSTIRNIDAAIETINREIERPGIALGRAPSG